MTRRNKVWFTRRFHKSGRASLALEPIPVAARDARIAGMWRVLLKDTPAAKLRRAGNPRTRRTFPRTGR
jgi:hypothetical protein